MGKEWCRAVVILEFTSCHDLRAIFRKYYFDKLDYSQSSRRVILSKNNLPLFMINDIRPRNNGSSKKCVPIWHVVLQKNLSPTTRNLKLFHSLNTEGSKYCVTSD